MARRTATAPKPPTLYQRWEKRLNSETARKWTHRLPALVVAGVALYVSYGHIRDVSAEHGANPTNAAILPLSVDGLLITAARYITKSKTILGKIIAATGFTLGVLATLAGNLLSVNDDNLISYGVAVWPAIAVVVTSVILHLGDAKAKPKPRTASKAPSVNAGASSPSIPAPRTRKTSIKSEALSEPSDA